MAGSKSKLVVKDVALMAMLTAILFVQEEVLTFLPNIQLTVFLIVLYSKKLGFTRASLIVSAHVVLDNLFLSSFSWMYTPAMWVGWMIIPCVICTLCRKIENPIILAIFGVLFALTYSWIFVFTSCVLFNMPFKAYIIADLPFEGLLAASSFVSILFLYKPSSETFDRFYYNKVED